MKQAACIGLVFAAVAILNVIYYQHNTSGAGAAAAPVGPRLAAGAAAAGSAAAATVMNLRVTSSVGPRPAAGAAATAPTVMNLRVNSRIQRCPYNPWETENITNVGTVVALDHRSIPRSMLPRLSTKGDAFIVDYSGHGQVPFHPIMYANVLGKKENERETQCREVNERVTIFPVFACNAVIYRVHGSDTARVLCSL